MNYRIIIKQNGKIILSKLEKEEDYNGQKIDCIRFRWNTIKQ